MLSKLRHFSRNLADEERTRIDKADPLPLCAFFGSRLRNVRPIQAGTLSTCLTGDLDGSPRFMKTHATEDGRVSLDKEIRLLQRIYAADLEVAGLTVESPDGSRLWLLMKMLEKPTRRLEVDEVLRTLDELRATLIGDYRPAGALDTFADVLREGWTALESLAANGHLSGQTEREVAGHLRRLQNHQSELKPLICHGDLGPANLMLDKDRVIAIDWEDAFLGFEGYDYLYWLTFFENRRYYSADIFNVTGLGRDIDVAILLLIVTIKSQISWSARRHAQNSLSFEERLTEILHIA